MSSSLLKWTRFHSCIYPWSLYSHLSSFFFNWYFLSIYIYSKMKHFPCFSACMHFIDPFTFYLSQILLYDAFLEHLQPLSVVRNTIQSPNLTDWYPSKYIINFPLSKFGLFLLNCYYLSHIYALDIINDYSRTLFSDKAWIRTWDYRMFTLISETDNKSYHL